MGLRNGCILALLNGGAFSPVLKEKREEGVWRERSVNRFSGVMGDGKSASHWRERLE